ncbi:NosD domain-containing protein [Candidatus Methanocrinis natronophilus]|uniref:NosD domain-containing protein n=1 Tax=Candidatus Methanocrinis natronophilus TaxID=3033396 RepID=UPI003743656C
MPGPKTGVFSTPAPRLYNDASNNYVGIRLVGSNNSTVRGNVASGNLEYGIMLEGSPWVT